MKAIVRSSYGSPDVLELRDIDEAGRQGRRACWSGSGRPRSTPRTSTSCEDGRPLPALPAWAVWGCARPTNRVLGLNVAGQVEAVGKDVTELPAR